MRNLNRVKMSSLLVRYLLFAALCACAACSGARRVQESVTVIEEYFGTPTSVLMKSTLQQVTSADIRNCLWNGTRCALRTGFVGSLPSLLGQPTTASARALAKAAERQLLCSNIVNQTECLLSYSCSWDNTTSNCVVADLLNLDDINGVAYCPGSRMDAAVHCAALTAMSEVACASSPYNCTLVGSANLPGGLLALPDNLLRGVVPAGSMGERLFSLALSQVSQFAAAKGASDLTDTLSNLLGGLQSSTSSSSASNSKVCVASWLQDTAFMGEVAKKLLKDVMAGSDVLSATLSDEVLGSCNGTQRLRDAVRACTQAVTAESCAAGPGCAWLDSARACVVTETLLPNLVLDSKDRWVSYLNNATRRCVIALNESDCKVADTQVAAGYFNINLPTVNVNENGNGNITIDIPSAAGALTVSLWSLVTGLVATVLMLVPRFEWL